MKPYFGLGANSALEDVISLSTALDGSNDLPGPALESFSKTRGPEVKLDEAQLTPHYHQQPTVTNNRCS